MLSCQIGTDAWYRALIESQIDYIIRIKPDGIMTFVNESYSKLYGRSKEELVGASIFPLIPEDQHQDVRAYLASLDQHNPVGTNERRVIGYDGTEYWVLWSDKVVLDDNGSVTEIQSVGRNITDRKMMETRLQESEENYRAVVNNTNDGIVVVQNDVVIFANPAFFEAIKSEEREVVNRSINDFIEPTVRAQFQAILSAVESSNEQKKTETVLQAKDHKPCVVKVKVKPISYRNLGFKLVIFRDVTSERESAEALVEQREWSKEILQSIRDGVITTDTQSRVSFLNRAAEKLTGWKLGKALGRSLKEVFPQAEEIFRKQGKKESLAEAYVASEHGGDYLSFSISPIQDISGHIRGHVFVVRNITDQVRRDAQISYLNSYDKLTGLYNRDYIEAHFERIDEPENLPLSVIMGDINGLKLANDRFGNKEGDRMLAKAASILAESCPAGIVARWGGDEFVIFLPKTAKKTAIALCGAIGERCRSYNCGTPLSISLGIGVKTDCLEPLTKVLRRAEDWMYQHKLLDNQSARSSLVSSLESSLKEKSFETEEHCRRMQQIAVSLGRALGLEPNVINELCLLSILHDIGKLAIPEQILSKEGPLNSLEWEIVKKHPETGFRIATASEELSGIAEGILSHHERWDGSGYPRGLKGKEIPLTARILSIVDSFDVMTNGRPYRQPISKKEALMEIQHCTGSQFDPELVEAFLRVVEMSHGDMRDYARN